MAGDWLAMASGMLLAVWRVRIRVQQTSTRSSGESDHGGVLRTIGINCFM